MKSKQQLGPSESTHSNKLHLPAARAPADQCTRSCTPTRTSAPSSSPPRWPRGGRPLAARGEAQTWQIQPASSPSQNPSQRKKQEGGFPPLVWWAERQGNLASGEHVWDGLAAEVGCVDDVLLPGRVPGSHSFGSRDGDAFRHANELLRSGGLGGGVPGLKELGRRTGTLNVNFPCVVALVPGWPTWLIAMQANSGLKGRNSIVPGISRQVSVDSMIVFVWASVIIKLPLRCLCLRMCLTASSCLMHSIVASSALVPRVASSSTALTVLSRDVTLVTITWQAKQTHKHRTVQ